MNVFVEMNSGILTFCLAFLFSVSITIAIKYQYFALWHWESHQLRMGAYGASNTSLSSLEMDDYPPYDDDENSHGEGSRSSQHGAQNNSFFCRLFDPLWLSTVVCFRRTCCFLGPGNLEGAL